MIKDGVIYFFVLSGEHEEMAKTEVEELLTLYNMKPRKISNENRVLVIETNDKINHEIIERLALTKYVGEMVEKVEENGEYEKIIEAAKNIELDCEKFAVRCHKITKNKNEIPIDKINREIGAIIGVKKIVDLDSPEMEVIVLIGDGIYLGVSKTKTGYVKCLKHHVNYRPEFYPISLNPRMARAMINVAGIKDDDILLDPFCGTGGILIEGADMNLKIIGQDVDKKMVDASLKNLNYFGFEGTVLEGDISKIRELQKIGVVVTDPPYGQSSSLKGELIDELMNRTIRVVKEILDVGKRLVIVVPKKDMIPIDGFELKHHFPWYSHKNLTRNVIVLERK